MMPTNTETERKSDASIEEKIAPDAEKVSIASVDVSRGDEALRLVGIERSAEFSEEYNLRLRRKLVSISSFF